MLAVGSDDPPMSCNDQPVERVQDADIPVDPSNVQQVLLEAFGLPKAGLDICMFVIGDGPMPANDAADTPGNARQPHTR